MLESNQYRKGLVRILWRQQKAVDAAIVRPKRVALEWESEAQEDVQFVFYCHSGHIQRKEVGWESPFHDGSRREWASGIASQTWSKKFCLKCSCALCDGNESTYSGRSTCLSSLAGFVQKPPKKGACSSPASKRDEFEKLTLADYAKPSAKMR